MAARKKAVNADTQITQKEFSKEQILASAKYSKRRDLVDALLKDNEKYTMETVDNMIEKFMKGKVK